MKKKLISSLLAFTMIFGVFVSSSVAAAPTSMDFNNTVQGPSSRMLMDHYDYNFITSLYENVLGRNASQGEYYYWFNTVQQDIDVVRAFYFGQEYNLGKVSPEKFVRDLYRGLLRREPDAGGYSYFVSALKDKKETHESLLNFFVSSAEFKNLRLRDGQW